jgi:hypothetical protein
MKKRMTFLFLTATILSLSRGAIGQPEISPDMYGVGEWDYVDSLGNHRVVLQVNENTDAVVADIPWRLREIGPERKNIVIIDAATSKKILNVFPFEINREHGHFAFQPITVPGTYYVYYLTYSKEGTYYPKVTYHPFENLADVNWIERNGLTEKASSNRLPNARIVQFQSINELNSFYPMEILATTGETRQLQQEYENEEAIFFTEDRRYPIRTKYDLPYKWIRERNTDNFFGEAKNGEYYTFQVGVYAFRKSINNIKVKYTKLVNKQSGSVISPGNFTCFNVEGIDVNGNYFEKAYSTPKGEIHPLWIGLDIPEKLTPGSYKGQLLIDADSMKTKSINLEIKVSDQLDETKGDNELWKHSRLRWLNSTIGEDNSIVAPFDALKLNREERSIRCLGRTVTLNELGLPSQITSRFTEAMTGFTDSGRNLLKAPVQFVIDPKNAGIWEELIFDYTLVTPGTVGWKSICHSKNFVMDLQAKMDFDGNINYEISLVALKDVTVSDIYLDVPLEKNVAKYMMGLGEKGGFLRNDIHWKWEVKKNQDGPWIGDVNAGVQVRCSDINYERPLNTNFYQRKPLNMPTSWYNNGQGGININRNEEDVTIRSYSGKRVMKKGEVFHFNFNIAITPFKPIAPKKQWSHRFFHNPLPVDSIAQYGANTINLHHANKYNPYINYPFLTPDIMRSYVDEAHAKDMKVKFYYTLRELSNSCPELFALRSLGSEVFSKGDGGGYSWLQEHLDQTYIAGWFDPTWIDAAIVNSGVSRWHNYYIEGLNWLVNEIGIDGIYIDDLAFDRTTMKRMRKVLERGNSEIYLDLHSANQFNPRDGFANSANLYLEHMPFVDRLWFGEYFDYDMRPDFWMVEVSGIPYGVMGEMLQDGGNPWRGMLYGMTGRAPRVNVAPLWGFWDEFGIENSDMIGYWVSNTPVKTDSKDSFATAYVQKGKKTVISLATWAGSNDSVKLIIDWDKLGLESAKSELVAPFIENFQEANKWAPGDKVTIPKGKGYLIVVQEKE